MIDDLITHLGTAAPTFVTIEHAWDSEPVEVERDSLPRLFVFPGDEDASNDGTDFAVSHRLSVGTHIYMVCLIADIETLKDELRTAVIGWNPDAAAGWDDTELASGRVVNLKGGVIWWEDVYSTWRTLRGVYS